MLTAEEEAEKQDEIDWTGISVSIVRWEAPLLRFEMFDGRDRLIWEVRAGICDLQKVFIWNPDD